MPVSCGRVYLCPGCQAESIPVAEYHRQTISLRTWHAVLWAREIVLTEGTEMASSNTGGLKDFFYFTTWTLFFRASALLVLITRQMN